MSGDDPETRGSFFDALRRRTVDSEIGSSVPRSLRVTTAYAWRLLVIAAAAGVVIWVVIQLKLLVIPLLVAILITALIWPAFTFLLRHRWPRWLAIVVSVIATIGVITGLLWLAIWQITREWSSVRARTVDEVLPPSRSMTCWVRSAGSCSSRPKCSGPVPSPSARPWATSPRACC